MAEKLRTIIAAAAERNGWARPADFVRALQAAGVGASRATMYHWWKGTYNVSAEYVPEVAPLLGVPEVTLYRLGGGR